MNANTAAIRIAIFVLISMFFVSCVEDTPPVQVFSYTVENATSSTREVQLSYCGKSAFFALNPGESRRTVTTPCEEEVAITVLGKWFSKIELVTETGRATIVPKRFF